MFAAAHRTIQRGEKSRVVFWWHSLLEWNLDLKLSWVSSPLTPQHTHRPLLLASPNIWPLFSSSSPGPILPSFPLPCPALLSSAPRDECMPCWQDTLKTKHAESPYGPEIGILHTEAGAGHSTTKAHSREGLDCTNRPSP